LGVGNILLQDEGVGVRTVEAMGSLPLPSNVELFDGATAGLDLLDVLADRKKVIIIDAIKGPYEPGTVLRLGPEDLVPEEAENVSLHDIGLLETLTVAKQLGIAPREVVILGVMPKALGWGLSLSREIDRLLPKLIQLILAELSD
jgi:hydrogenase maturation protease